MNEKYKDYLKDLPPELQEKAKDIKTNEELLEFLSDNDVELPEDALEAVSGGNGCDGESAPCAHTSVSKLESFEGPDLLPPGVWGEYYSAQCNGCGAILYYFGYGQRSKEQYDMAKEKARRWEEESKKSFDKAFNKFVHERACTLDK